jgi:hypothetical protein
MASVKHSYLNVVLSKAISLSPSLLNIFINGMVDELKAGNCDPVQIGEISVNCLLYAYDIVLLSESKSGL